MHSIRHRNQFSISVPVQIVAPEPGAMLHMLASNASCHGHLQLLWEVAPLPSVLDSCSSAGPARVLRELSHEAEGSPAKLSTVTFSNFPGSLEALEPVGPNFAKLG